MLGVGAELRAMARTRTLKTMPQDLHNMLKYSPEDIQAQLLKIKKSAQEKGIEDVRSRNQKIIKMYITNMLKWVERFVVSI